MLKLLKIIPDASAKALLKILSCLNVKVGGWGEIDLVILLLMNGVNIT